MKASLTLYGTPVVPGVSYAKTAWRRSVSEPEETAETIPAESRGSGWTTSLKCFPKSRTQSNVARRAWGLD